VVHLAPSTRGRRRLDVVIGGLLAILGIVVAVLAVVALHQPKGHQAAKGSGPATGPTTASISASAVTSAVTSTSTTTSASSSATPSKSSSGTASTAGTGVKSIPLVVLNSTNKSGLAASAAKTFSAGGWTVTSAGNIVNNIASTCAYYDPSDPKNQAAAAALMSQFPAIKRIKEKFAELPAGPVVVVLTSDYS
jgi:hypothetical protein